MTTRVHRSPSLETSKQPAPAKSAQARALAPGHHVVSLQRSIGNRAVTGLIDRAAVQRHGAPEEEPLQALHDPVLQRHGAPEEEPLQAFHDRSMAYGGTRHRKALAVQRQPAVIQRVDTGIAKGKAVGKYIKSIVGLKPKWKGMDANSRAAELGKAANARLRDADVAPCAINVKSFGGGTNGQFDFTTWTIDIDKELVDKDEITDAELSGVADTMYHEARHAEQWFRIARWLAGTKKKTATEIATEMAIPEATAKKAAAKKLKESGKTARKLMGAKAIAEEKQMLAEAEAWHKNIYGTGRVERNKTLDNLEPTSNAYLDAKKEHEDKYAGAVKKNQDAEKAYLDANKNYEERLAEYSKALAAYRASLKKGGDPSGVFAVMALGIQVELAEGLKDQAFEDWKNAWDEMEALDKKLDTATKEAIKAHKKYTALVEEADAWALGDRVQKAYAEKVAKKGK